MKRERNGDNDESMLESPSKKKKIKKSHKKQHVPFTPTETETLIKAIKEIGTKWDTIIKSYSFENKRSRSQVKDHYNKLLEEKIITKEELGLNKKKKRKKYSKRKSKTNDPYHFEKANKHLSHINAIIEIFRQKKNIPQSIKDLNKYLSHNELLISTTQRYLFIKNKKDWNKKYPATAIQLKEEELEIELSKSPHLFKQLKNQSWIWTGSLPSIFEVDKSWMEVN
mmetsp:Transcript_12308/g.18377  ORF Transcript_12308/g.18377 Transcript_12308/m.18377 type:complete len:225 (-) Transcript_12308:1501-2175(-)